MKAKNVVLGFISLYVNFHNNWTMWSMNLVVKFCWCGEKETEPQHLNMALL